MLVVAPGAGLDETVARNAVLAQLGAGMKITIQRVDSIPRTANGKLQVVVRAIPAVGAL
jgi:acyl-coenzyme A synthetase/AMP-(fatty) acid ligase